MRLTVRLLLTPKYHRLKGYVPQYISFESVVLRLHRPLNSSAALAIFADVDVPDKYRPKANPSRRNADGSYRVDVIVEQNRKSVADFLARGITEMDVREVES